MFDIGLTVSDWLIKNWNWVRKLRPSADAHALANRFYSGAAPFPINGFNNRIVKKQSYDGWLIVIIRAQIDENVVKYS